MDEMERWEVKVAFAISCLRDNHARGWYEIARTRGFVNCQDGRIATRVDGVVEQHASALEAALRLVA